MFTATKKVGCCVALACAAFGIFGVSGSASAVSLTSPPQPFGNHGANFFPIGANFTLTGTTNITKAQEFNPTATGLAGTVDSIGLGTGVQSATGQGSKAIAGQGQNAISELVAHFATTVSFDSIVLDMSQLNMKPTLGHGTNPFIFVENAVTHNWTLINQTNWGSAFHLTSPSTGVLNLGLLGIPNFGVSELKLRETNQLIYASGLSASPSVHVPEPTTWMILGSGLAFVAILKRRKEGLRQEV